MCNCEEDFVGIAKYKHKYTKVDKYVMCVCRCMQGRVGEVSEIMEIYFSLSLRVKLPQHVLLFAHTCCASSELIIVRYKSSLLCL